jgi:hypothetical protein
MWAVDALVKIRMCGITATLEKCKSYGLFQSTCGAAILGVHVLQAACLKVSSESAKERETNRNKKNGGLHSHRFSIKKRGMQSRMKGGREHPVLHASAILESTVKKQGGGNSLPALFSLAMKAV